MPWLYMAGAIFCEIIATSALKSAEGFTRPLPTALVLIGYGIAFYCLSVALKTIPVGIAYAVWSGVGIVAISLIGLFYYRQTIDAAGLIGMALIVAGVIVINLFSRTAQH